MTNFPNLTDEQKNLVDSLAAVCEVRNAGVFTKNAFWIITKGIAFKIPLTKDGKLKKVVTLMPV